MRKRILVLVWMLFLITPNVCLSQEEVIMLDEIVVTASRLEEVKTDTPCAIDVITEEDIRKTNAETLTEALAKNTSVDVIKYPGVLSVVNLRGFRPELFTDIKSHSLLVNGRRAGGINLSTFLLEDVERIEVLKGPASSLYGSEAMAGVINIITKRSKGRIKTRLDLEGGSFDYWEVGLSSGGAINERFDFDLNLKGIGMGDYTVPKYSVGDWKWEGGTWKGNNYKNYSCSLRTRYNISKNHSLNLRTDLFLGEDIKYAGDIFGEYGPGKKDLERYSIDLSYEGKTEPENYKWLIKVFCAHDECLYYERTQQDTWYKSLLGYTNYLGFQTQGTVKLPFKNQLMTFGVDYNQDKGISKRYGADGKRISPYRPDSEKVNWACFFENKLSLPKEKLIFTLGARYDNYNLKTLETPYFDKLLYEPGKEKLSSFNPRCGAVYKLKEFIRFRTSVGTAFIIPNPYQKAGYYTSWGITTRGNPALKPEKSLSYDVGCGITISPVDIELGYFSTHVKDKIESKALSPTEISFENIAKAKMNGIESTFSFDFGRLLKLRRFIKIYSNLTHLFRARDITNDKDLYNVAKTKINCGIEYDDGKLSGRINFRHVGRMKERNWFRTAYINQVEIEYGNFTVTDLNLSYKITEDFTINCKVNNLFNIAYEEKPGYPMPGREISAGISVKF